MRLPFISLPSIQAVNSQGAEQNLGRIRNAKEKTISKALLSMSGDITWNHISRIHGILILEKAEAIHEFDFCNLASSMALEMLFDILLGDWRVRDDIVSLCQYPRTQNGSPPESIDRRRRIRIGVSESQIVPEVDHEGGQHTIARKSTQIQPRTRDVGHVGLGYEWSMAQEAWMDRWSEAAV